MLQLNVLVAYLDIPGPIVATGLPIPLQYFDSDSIIDTLDSVPWIGNNATCAADPSCAAHSFSISKN